MNRYLTTRRYIYNDRIVTEKMNRMKNVREVMLENKLGVTDSTE